MVTGFLVAGAYAFGRLRGRWGRYERTALAIPLTIAALASVAQVLVGDWNGREVASSQPTKLAAFEGLRQHDHGRAGAHPRLVHGRRGRVRDPRSRSCSRCSPSTAPNATVQGLDAVPPADRPPVNVVRFAFQTMVGIGTLLALLSASSTSCVAHPAAAAAGVDAGSTARSSLAGPLVGGRADRRLGDDRGRPPALGRLPRDAHLGGGDRRRAASPSATPRSRSSTCARVAVAWVAPAPARSRPARPGRRES